MIIYCGKGEWLYHCNISLEDLFDEFVFGGVHQLDDVTIKSVSILLKETCECPSQQHTPQALDVSTMYVSELIKLLVTPTFRFIVNHSSKVLDAKLCLMVVLWRDVVCVEFVLKVQLVQHCSICALQNKGQCKCTAVMFSFRFTYIVYTANNLVKRSPIWMEATVVSILLQWIYSNMVEYSLDSVHTGYLWEFALFIDKWDDVHGFDGDHVQSVLIVSEFNVLPVDVL